MAEEVSYSEFMFLLGLLRALEDNFDDDEFVEELVNDLGITEEKLSSALSIATERVQELTIEKIKDGEF